jgi:hypothetical protein
VRTIQDALDHEAVSIHPVVDTVVEPGPHTARVAPESAPPQVAGLHRPAFLKARSDLIKAPIFEVMQIADEIQTEVQDDVYLRMANATRNVYNVVEELDQRIRQLETLTVEKLEQRIHDLESLADSYASEVEELRHERDANPARVS